MKKVDNELVIEGHRWQYLWAVTDELNLELRQVIPKDRTPSKEYVYVYEYTDEIGPTRRPNTKYRLCLTMPQPQIESELSKNILKVKTVTPVEAKKEPPVEEKKLPVGKPQQLF